MNTVEKPAPAGVVAQFLRDFAASWRALPDKGLFLALLAAWLALFQFLGNSTLGYFKTHSLFGWLNFVYDTSTDDGHGIIVPFVVLALFWWKRNELLQLPKQVWWPALGLIFLGLAAHIVGFVIQQTRVSVAGFFLGLYGLTGLVWGRLWLRHSLFPFFLFIFCIPLATVVEPLTFHLRMLVAYIVANISQLLGIDVIREGSQLFNAQRTFGFDVAPACSGIRSLIALVALTIIYGFVAFRSPKKRWFMLAMAAPLAVLANVVRVSFVIVTAEVLGQEAGAAVEKNFGYMTFLLAIGGIVLLGYWLREPEAHPAPVPMEPRA